MVGLRDLPTTFRTREALALGVHPRALYRWRDVGEIVELSRGVFRRADADPASDPDAIGVMRRVRHAVLYGLTAAVIHDLTDEIPSEVQIAVQVGRTVPRISYPPTKVFRFREAQFRAGITEFEAAPGEWVPVYDPARTVVDLMRMRMRFGQTVAYSALNRYLDRGGADLLLLRQYADLLDVSKQVQFALDIARSR